MNTSHGFCQQILYVFDVSRHDESFRIGLRRVVTILSSAATPEFNGLLRVGVKSAQTLIHGDSFAGLARLGVRFALLFHTLSSSAGSIGRIITNRSLVPATDEFHS